VERRDITQRRAKKEEVKIHRKVEEDRQAVLNTDIQTNNGIADTPGTGTIQTNPGTGPVKEAVTGDEAGMTTDRKMIIHHEIITDVREVTAKGVTTTGREAGRKAGNHTNTNGLGTAARMEMRTIRDETNVDTMITTRALDTGIVRQTGAETTDKDIEMTVEEEHHSGKQVLQTHNWQQ
jgi:hypothetical protein